MKTVRLLASLLFMLALLSNCQTTGVNEASADKSGYPEQAVAVTDASSPASTALASAGPLTSDYRISPRDVLDVSVFQVPDLNKQVEVSADGDITLPLIGKTGVRGKTTQQAQDVIARKLRKKYLQSPQVSVSIRRYGQKVTVSGAVMKPAVLSVDGAVTLSQAVAQSGGLSDTANANRVHIARVVNHHVRDNTYNLDAIQSGQAADPTLHAGDIVVAEQSGAKVAFKNIKDLLPFAVLASIL